MKDRGISDDPNTQGRFREISFFVLACFFTGTCFRIVLDRCSTSGLNIFGIDFGIIRRLADDACKAIVIWTGTLDVSGIFSNRSIIRFNAHFPSARRTEFDDAGGFGFVYLSLVLKIDVRIDIHFFSRTRFGCFFGSFRFFFAEVDFVFSVAQADAPEVVFFGLSADFLFRYNILMNTYDCIVIGGGPGGMAAAIYLARQKVRFLLLTDNIGGQTLWSSDVENYLGFHLLNGIELVEHFQRHLKDYEKDFELRQGEPVKAVEKKNGGFVVKTDKGEYETKTVLVTTGTKHRELGVPGEKDLYGKGVTYCATCDAPLFKDKPVHVVGGGNSAMESALFLSKYASQITMLSINPDLEGDETLVKKCKSDSKVRIVGGVRTARITGTDFVNGIDYADSSGQEVHEDTQGVFIEIGLIPVSDFINLVEKNKWNEIVVDKSNATSVPGIWAAGDVTDVTEKQIAVAVGEGSKASLQIIKFLQSSS